jgi:1,4-dihydroxy-2-naphthoate octaprenyltransferase
MERLRPWLDAAKPDQAVLAVLAAEIGAACARFDARPGGGIVPHLLVDLAALAASIGVSLDDHAWDVPGQEPIDPKHPPPERERPLDARESGLAGGATLLVAGVFGLVLALVSGAAAAGYGLCAVLLGVWRRAPAVGADTLGYGLGDLATALALGPCAVLSGFAAQAGEGSAGAFYSGIPIGMAAASAAFFRHFTRRRADGVLHRVTPLASLGDERARMCAVLLPIAAAAGVLAARHVHEYAPASWLACLPLAGVAAFAAWRLDDAATDREAGLVERFAFSAVALAELLVLLTYRIGAAS